MSMKERDAAIAERRKARMEADYEVNHTPERTPAPDIRVAEAMEYIAYQLGQMNRKLGQVVQLLDEKNAKGD